MTRLDEAGERADVQGTPRTHNEQWHLRRYEWAATMATGDILDAACGTGYGSALLSISGRVTGIDADVEAVEYAAARSPGTFIAGTLPELPFEDASFDAVVSFETIEHVADAPGLLKGFRRILRPGGKLLLSTPNRVRPGAVSNPFHVREYDFQELRDLLMESGFSQPSTVLTHRCDPTSSFALRLVARFPSLCRPDRWWDTLAHGDGSLIAADVIGCPVLVIAVE
jgi:SAM-dependent methyltransferase